MFVTGFPNNMIPPLFPVQRWWPWVLAAALPLLLFFWFRPRHVDALADTVRKAQTLAGAPSPFGAPFAERGHGVAAADSTRLRGVSWVGGDSITAEALAPLRRDHVSWIAQTPFGWQAGVATPAVQLHTARPGGRRWGLWGESDAGLVHTARLARARGIRTFLKPHLWVRGSASGWAGDVKMTTPADWDAWFVSYTAFILHYARLAETEHFDLLCIGTELVQATEPDHEAAWRALIRQVRTAYHGPLTYAANYDEYQQVHFWDALDYVGVQAYFPLSREAQPGLPALLAGWRPHLRALAQLQQRVGKPVIFTEVGYKPAPGAAAEPWKWPARGAADTPDDALQARCYEALFRACWDLPWLKGVFIWKWYPDLAADGPARRHADFTPQHKPAEAILARWYGQ